MFSIKPSLCYCVRPPLMTGKLGIFFIVPQVPEAIHFFTLFSLLFWLDNFYSSIFNFLDSFLNPLHSAVEPLCWFILCFKRWCFITLSACLAHPLRCHLKVNMSQTQHTISDPTSVLCDMSSSPPYPTVVPSPVSFTLPMSCIPTFIPALHQAPALSHLDHCTALLTSLLWTCWFSFNFSYFIFHF